MENPFKDSPLQEITDSLLTEKGVRLFIKRDDLIHPEIQGNKWRKLKYNLLEARMNGINTLLTFGGPFSNHIYALAAAAKLFHFKAIGIIRGEEPEVLSPTLQYAAGCGMDLHYMDRESYRQKDEPANLESLRVQIGNFYLVPEGGTNNFALEGVAEIIEETGTGFDYICTACGTGGTLAGLVAALKGDKKAIGFSSLKGEDTLTAKVNGLVEEFAGKRYNNFSVNFDYNFGGYAKVNPALIDFIKGFKQKYDIQLEPVYTGKMFYGIFDLIRKDYFPEGAAIMAVHTGGLQGLKGFMDYFPELELDKPV
ncbi:MAG TPA: pyridoxal-phosphate dependent enzyme [Chitinophagales bacterium]|nr:pyridoxal-phosphate dependent enzyme [Chitinophagales bacterium]